jgi:hypothetical protein
MKHWLLRNVGILSVLVLLAPRVSADVIVEFPSTDSFTGGPSGSGVLGTGGGGQHFNAGDFISQTYLVPELGTTTRSRWRFSMTDFTFRGVVNEFDVRINGSTIGTFSFVGVADGCCSETVHALDLLFNHSARVGPRIALSMIATSTVPDGFSSWNWLPNGSVTLFEDSAPVPEPTTVALLGTGLVSLIVRRRIQRGPRTK